MACAFLLRACMGLRAPEGRETRAVTDPGNANW